MIHEYRTYTIHPDRFDEYCMLAETRGIPIRRDDYGPLVGFFVSYAGTHCQIHHLWEYDGLDARNAARHRLEQNPRWMEEFIAHSWPTMQRQEVRFMTPQGQIIVPVGRHVYEARIYRCVVGRFSQTVELVKSRPRSAGTKLVGVYTSESPDPNEVVELVALENARDPLLVQSEAADERKWLATHAQDLLGIRSTSLVPLPMSPMQ